MRDPIDQLERCHRRLEEACDALAVAVHDRDAQTVEDVRAFFGRQIKRHEEDEEQSLFPLLTSPEVRDVLDRLAGEHREHEGLIRDLDDAAKAVIAGGPDEAWSQLATIADAIRAAYAKHIELEEKQLFPLARALGPSEREQLSNEMEARRGR